MTKAEREERDRIKLAEMKVREDELRSEGYRYVAGLDEVGRGPLAGPVYAACVILPPDFDVPGVNDSKKLSAKRREELSEIIKERCLAYGIGIADNSEIDRINILEATKNAMKRALSSCKLMLKEKGLLDKLAPKLQQAAKAREENPEATLTELAEMMEPPITKPAMNHRLKKLVLASKEG
jgi:ribonuclease HII